MVGIVLAAGAGSRLYPLTSQKPKTLLEIAPSLTILGLALRNLSSAGCSEIAIVVGDDSVAIERWLLTTQNDPTVDVTLVPTGRDPSWNNAFSLWSARDWLQRGAMILNGDTVLPGEVVRKLATGHSAGECALAVDRRAALAPEEMKVTLQADDRIVAIGKDLDPRHAHGEFVGLSYIPAEQADVVALHLENAFLADRTSWYEDGYGRFIAAGSSMRGRDIGVTDWVEVDTPDDLARARNLKWLSQ